MNLGFCPDGFIGGFWVRNLVSAVLPPQYRAHCFCLFLLLCFQFSQPNPVTKKTLQGSLCFFVSFSFAIFSFLTKPCKTHAQLTHVQTTQTMHVRIYAITHARTHMLTDSRTFTDVRTHSRTYARTNTLMHAQVQKSRLPARLGGE
jgi:uncharacterized membrane protein